MTKPEDPGETAAETLTTTAATVDDLFDPENPSATNGDQNESSDPVTAGQGSAMDQPGDDNELDGEEDAATHASSHAGRPTPRLAIRKMVLENFKSYAGRVEVGPFHKSFTSIVGPNGSGKSNVIDSLLFVFGFKAKKMRQEKLSGLIHSSQAYPNLDSCTVEIHFYEILDLPDPDAFEIVPDSELVVARTATKSNKSQYYINGKASNYTEVTNLLKGRGIDLEHKRFLILQGEVESIAQMKAKAVNEHEDGLLEYLEDIIGTSKYKEPIEESSLQLEKFNEERMEKVNRLKIVEGDMKALETQKKDAEDYLREEDTLTKIKSKLYQYYVYEAETNVATAKAEVDKLGLHLAEQNEKLKEESKEMKQLQTSHNSISSEYEKLRSQADGIQKDFAAFEREYIQLEEKKKHFKQKRKKLEKAIEKDSYTRSENEVWTKNHQQDLDKKTAELEKLAENLKNAEAELGKIRDQLKGKTEVFQAQIDAKKQELVPWNDKMNAKKSEIDIKQSELQLLIEKTTYNEKVLEEARVHLLEQQALLEQRRSDIKEFEKQRAQLQKCIKQTQQSLATVQEREQALREASMQSRQQLETSRTAAQAATSRDELIKRLLAERDSGRIPGIYGRLSDLGAIDDKYDVAITSSYSERLKWIVVDTVQTAEKCLKILKSQNIGRASFIVMERTPEARENVVTPENVPRLVDLVKPKDRKFKKAFYYILRDTLVAGDLDQANRIAFGRTRWKVVTLDGKVIDKSGTMSGGGNRVARGGMSSAIVDDVRPEDIAKLEKAYSVSEKELRALHQNREELEATLENNQKALPRLEEQLQKAITDISTAEKMIVNYNKRIAECEKSAAPDKADLAQISKLQKEIAKLEAEAEKLSEKASAIHEAIKKLQDKILEVGGDQLRRQSARVKDIEDQIEVMTDSYGNVESKLKTSKKNLEKAIKAIETNEKELEELDSEMKTMQADVEAKMERAVEVQERIEEAKKLAETKKKDLAEIKQQLDAKSEIVNEIKQSKVEVENSYSDWNKLLTDNQKKSQHWRVMQRDLRLQFQSETEEEGANLREYAEDELKRFDKEDLKREMVVLEEKLSEAKPNLAVLDEYKQREADYLSKVAELDGITKTRDEMKATYDDLRKRRLDEFMTGFSIISQKLKEMYQMITLGGNAELELVDSLDPFSEGITFSVMPPKKSWKSISNLSGGEKTLSSLALVFALHHYKPTPLYVMDEIDAALDFRNVSIIANYIKERTKNAQFVIISLRNNMFELADRLVGIYKTENCTKSIAVNPGAVGVAAR